MKTRRDGGGPKLPWGRVEEGWVCLGHAGQQVDGSKTGWHRCATLGVSGWRHREGAPWVWMRLFLHQNRTISSTGSPAFRPPRTPDRKPRRRCRRTHSRKPAADRTNQALRGTSGRPKCNQGTTANTPSHAALLNQNPDLNNASCHRCRASRASLGDGFVSAAGALNDVHENSSRQRHSMATLSDRVDNQVRPVEDGIGIQRSSRWFCPALHARSLQGPTLRA